MPPRRAIPIPTGPANVREATRAVAHWYGRIRAFADAELGADELPPAEAQELTERIGDLRVAVDHLERNLRLVTEMHEREANATRERTANVRRDHRVIKVELSKEVRARNSKSGQRGRFHYACSCGHGPMREKTRILKHIERMVAAVDPLQRARGEYGIRPHGDGWIE